MLWGADDKDMVGSETFLGSLTRERGSHEAAPLESLGAELRPKRTPSSKISAAATRYFQSAIPLPEELP